MTILPTSDRPLSGLRVVVTRPADPRDALAVRLRELGAEVLVQPAICIGPPVDWQPVDAALARLHEFDWLVFLSANGVRYLLDRLTQAGGVARLAGVRIAAIGPGTADELARYQVRAELVPEQFRAEALAEALSHEAPGRRFLLARASRGREVLAEQLAAAGARGASRRLFEQRYRATESGGCRRAPRGTDRLDHRDQFRYCPLAGKAVWP